MAKSQSVWGIEIGQTALKALRCTMVDGEVMADAFDFIEYPKILSQPEADADELVADAINQLLERNDAITDKVCISVPGQSGLAKFFKPPPVEVKKVGDIVRYEARQQIPFDLADVVWDFQMMPGSMVEEGYALESEVGLFAMKREQAYRQLAPFDHADIEVDVVQLAPLSLYNMLAYDRMNDRLDADVFDPDNPPASTVVLSIGTDSSDLIITNGFRIWQRSMPIGGNHFTRQLTKDLKLTFAKAEHLKRNAREAVDPKLVFQTMRPVFNDLVTEVQRSIGFFRSLDKKAEIGDLLLTGNTVKMPGLAAYLEKNLGYDVQVLDRFNRLTGDDVLANPAFRDNAPTFAVCYGLCLQGLNSSQMHTSLVPREILTERMIRAKKPWTVAALAVLLLGMSGHYAFTERSWATTHDDLWSNSLSAVTTMEGYKSDHEGKDSELDAKLSYLNVMGKEVSGNAERRLKWLEIIKTVNNAVPRKSFVDGKIPTRQEVPLDEREDIHITRFDTKYYEDLQDWWTEELAQRYREEIRNWALLTNNELDEEAEAALASDTGPEGAGWVFELSCYHDYNKESLTTGGGEIGSNHVRRVMTSSFLPDNPLSKTVELPRPDGGQEVFTLAEMGILYPLMLDDNEPKMVKITNPDYDPAAAFGEDGGEDVGNGQDDDGKEPAFFQVPRLEFVFQMVWQEQPLAERVAKKDAERAAAKEAKEQEEAQKRAEDAAAAATP
ncbi:MAG: pilus assembly protein PilM [Saprospirales bacterium TMED214]|nr:MAG: pilus assembly protein PilM [Saprospirales bacterium TMED214]